ncbi:hypothetical protein [Azospirillum soli]|uniref:hypothetical protein n=1 Tax=Azospirillum soli TaxID=1304799 RepID=UPI001FE61673|nr:hypothetical protein [Azospirillum soli]MBP2310806.1 hypothetical protein [Azospirillum soli]
MASLFGHVARHQGGSGDAHRALGHLGPGFTQLGKNIGLMAETTIYVFNVPRDVRDLDAEVTGFGGNVRDQMPAVAERTVHFYHRFYGESL